ncbi:unnamed protein product [Durusdinium trenchii]|uniref:Uncharacterized protein n=1 Tax=Durusdinium trenchii TaxID=1381693 RepID=A0ABP0L4A9_9DINO
MARRSRVAVVVALAALAAYATTATCFVASPWRDVVRGHRTSALAGRTTSTAAGRACSAPGELGRPLAICLAAAVLACGGLRGLRPRHGLPTCREGRVARRAWPWEEEDPYAKCTALKLQLGMQFSKNMLTTLNKLADGADTSSDAGLHQLMLDVVLALKRSETTWRYADCVQLLFDAEDEGRAAAGKLQRWGLEAQEKWGDGDWEKEKEDKIRSAADVKKILGAISEVQEDELLQLDVQWIPEEEGDSLSAMEVTMKFPELVMI